MRLFTSFIITQITLLLFFSQASAAVYLSANVLASQLNDSDIDAQSTEVGTLEFETGYGTSLAIGTWFTPSTPGRIELEGSYRINDVKEGTIFGQNVSTLDGSSSRTSLMFNAIHDYNDVNFIFKPFFSLGIGATYIELDLGEIGKADDTVFTYQASIGESYRLTKKTFFDLQYRYLGTTEPTFSSSNPAFSEFDYEHSSHNILLGVRHTF